ncbi:hypothetical protein LEN26_020386 [Aphanomyces euteiches]|nr:hypothetical protein LEN26_020386 [Aphanomyces euteiches]
MESEQENDHGIAGASTRQSTGRKKTYTILYKLKVVLDYERQPEPRSFYRTAKDYGLDTGQVKRRVQAKENLQLRAKSNPSSHSLNTGRQLNDSHRQVEDEVYEYWNELRDDDIAVSTNMLIIKALSVDPSFHGGSSSALTKWVYQFMERRKLAIRRPTRCAQKLSANLAIMRKDFVESIKDRHGPFGKLAEVAKSYIVNMDETPVNVEPEIKTTIAVKGSKTVPARKCSSSNPRTTVALAITADGKKLAPLVVPGARIESSLSEWATSNGLHVLCQTNAWMDDATTSQWIKRVWIPYVADQPSSLLIWDDYSCHKTKRSTPACSKAGTECEIIPGVYQALKS